MNASTLLAGEAVRAYRIISRVGSGAFLLVVGGVIYGALSVGVLVALQAAIMLLGAGAYPLAFWMERRYPEDQV